MLALVAFLAWLPARETLTVAARPPEAIDVPASPEGSGARQRLGLLSRGMPWGEGSGARQRAAVAAVVAFAGAPAVGAAVEVTSAAVDSLLIWMASMSQGWALVSPLTTAIR